MILVVGGTGELGSRIVKRLRSGGHEVRGLVRPETDAALLHELGVEVVSGDLADPRSLPAACVEVDTVVASATAIARMLGGAKHPSIHEADEVGMTSLVEAAEGATRAMIWNRSRMGWLSPTMSSETSISRRSLVFSPSSRSRLRTFSRASEPIAAIAPPICR